MELWYDIPHVFPWKQHLSNQKCTATAAFAFSLISFIMINGRLGYVFCCSLSNLVVFWIWWRCISTWSFRFTSPTVGRHRRMVLCYSIGTLANIGSTNENNGTGYIMYQRLVTVLGHQFNEAAYIRLYTIAISWTIDDLYSLGHCNKLQRFLFTNQAYSLTDMHSNVTSGKWRPFVSFPMCKESTWHETEMGVYI